MASQGTKSKTKSLKPAHLQGKKGKKNVAHNNKDEGTGKRFERKRNYSRRRNGNRRVVKRDINVTRRDAVSYPIDARDKNTTHTVNLGQSVPGCQYSTIVSPYIAYDALLGVSLCSISYAYSSGISTYSSARAIPGLPYYATIYMTKILESYVLNTTPISTKVPLFLAVLGNALRPKSVPFKSGIVQYSWQYTPNLNQLQPFKKFGGENWREDKLGVFYMYVMSEQTDNGLTVCEAPEPYTQELGEKSFGILSTFFSKRNFPMWESVSYDHGMEFSTDASAFSYPITVLGYGIGNGGAWGLGTALEVPIFHPMLGVFATQDKLVRYPKFYRNIAGDSLFLTGLLHLHTSPKVLRMKNQVVFKCVDFYEICDVVLRWCVRLFQEQYRNTIANTQYTQNNIGIGFNNFILLMRSYLVQMFGTTQPAVQSIFPTQPNNELFIPFVVGSNCHPSNDAASVLLPSLLVENIRCLSARSIISQTSPGPKKSERNNPLLYVPVLGIWSDINLDRDSYYYEVNGEQVSIFSEEDFPQFVSPVDGTVSTSVYQISNTGYIRDLAKTWNNFANSMSPYSMTLDNQGESEGINALQVITMTNVVSPTTMDVDLKARKVTFPSGRTNDMIKYKAALEKSNGKMRVGDLGAYELRALYGTTAQVAFDKRAWSEIQTYWIKPVSIEKINASVNQNLDIYSSATYTNEPYIVHSRDSYSPGNNLPSLGECHQDYANLMVKGIVGRKTQVEEQLIHWGKTGRGGLLSGLVSGLANLIPI